MSLFADLFLELSSLITTVYKLVRNFCNFNQQKHTIVIWFK